MKNYEIAIPVTGFKVYFVEAESEDAARDAVLNGCDDFDCEYELDQNLDYNTWEVCEL